MREHLLEMEVSKDDRYEKQRDTLILWTDNAGNVMALSFEEEEKCAEIWDFVTEVQRRFRAGVPLRR
jgi:protein phosphatase-4 regulatory subunit 3